MKQYSNATTYSRRESFFLTAAMVGAGALPACSKSARKAMTAVDTHPAGYPTVEAVRYFGEIIERESEGRLRLKLFPGGQLGQEKDTLEITVFGGLDINRVNLAPLNSIAKETFVPALPFMFRSVAHMRAAVDGEPGKTVLQSLEGHGLIGLCFFDSGARSFYTTKRPIQVPEDLKGLKIRVQSSDLFVSMVEALGGDATPMSFGEVYQGLLQGVVDGAENNWPSYENTRHFEAAKYYSLTRHVMSPEVLVMSKKKWETLHENDRELLKRAARMTVPYMRDLWDQRVVRSREIVLNAGVEIFEPDIRPFQDRVQPVWDRYLDTPQLRKLAENIQNVTVPSE